VISIGNSIDPSNFKETGTRNYWINNNIDIWNSLTVVLGLKLETGYTPTNLNRLRFENGDIIPNVESYFYLNKEKKQLFFSYTKFV
jgi:hypothetical protein